MLNKSKFSFLAFSSALSSVEDFDQLFSHYSNSMKSLNTKEAVLKTHTSDDLIRKIFHKSVLINSCNLVAKGQVMCDLVMLQLCQSYYKTNNSSPAGVNEAVKTSLDTRSCKRQTRSVWCKRETQNTQYMEHKTHISTWILPQFCENILNFGLQKHQIILQTQTECGFNLKTKL